MLKSKSQKYASNPHKSVPKSSPSNHEKAEDSTGKSSRTQEEENGVKGYSLHIGLNKYDNDQYGVSIPQLFSTHNDVNELEAIAVNKGFITTKLLDEQANYENVINYLEKFAQQVKAGDIFWLTFSGHGTRVFDISDDEEDHFDEAFVLYDRLLLDDEFQHYLSLFGENVRILLIVDACHSGTISRRTSKKLPRFVPSSTWIDCESQPYEKTNYNAQIKGTGILLAACQDNEVAYETENNGLFTSELKKVIKTGVSPKKAMNMITEKLKGKQKPNYLTFGKKSGFPKQNIGKI